MVAKLSSYREDLEGVDLKVKRAGSWHSLGPLDLQVKGSRLPHRFCAGKKGKFSEYKNRVHALVLVFDFGPSTSRQYVLIPLRMGLAVDGAVQRLLDQPDFRGKLAEFQESAGCFCCATAEQLALRVSTLLSYHFA